MENTPIRAVIVLCLNRTDGLLEHTRQRIAVVASAYVYVWDVYTANRVAMAKDVFVHSTEGFHRNPQRSEIERILSSKSAYNDGDITFVNADGVMYPCTWMELRIAGGGGEAWNIEATLALAFGFTLEIAAGAVAIEHGRKGCTFRRCIVLRASEGSSTD